MGLISDLGETEFNQVVDKSDCIRLVFNQSVEEGGGHGRGTALAHVRRAGRPDSARPGGPPRRGGRDAHRARDVVRRVGPSRLQAPEGAGGGRPGPTYEGRPAPSLPSGGGGSRPDDRMDRKASARGRGALPAPRRGARADGGRGAPRTRQGEAS